MHGPQEDAKTTAAEARAFTISSWFNVEDEVREAGTSGIGATGFAAALEKLKKGKNSHHGLAAEVLQHLHLEWRAQLSADTTRRMRSLDLPEE